MEFSSDQRSERRLARIKEIPILQILEDLGYTIRQDSDREQQFSCDLHGDGSDGKPSARVYPESNSFYCFACGKTRDAIETIREKKGLGFLDALKWLEHAYHLAPLPWMEGEERHQNLTTQLESSLRVTRSFEDDKKSLHGLLMGITLDRDLEMQQVLSLWEAFDKVAHLVESKNLTEVLGRAALEKIRLKTLEALRLHEH